MASENVTTKFKVDISNLKQNITAANKQIKNLTAQLKNASAGMAKGEETADSLTKKIEIQAKIVEEERKKLDFLRAELEKYNSTIKSGEKTVKDLTAQHEAAVKAYGAESKEAQALAKQLYQAQTAQEKNVKAAQDLNTKIIEQDTAFKNAEYQADQYVKALDDLQNAEENTDEAFAKSAGSGGGLDVFSVALGNLAANLITACIDKLGDLISTAKEAFEELDEGRDTLIRATGATGEVAESLTESYHNVAKSINADLSDIGGVIGEVNTRFGYTGEQLEETALQFLKFSDIAGVDAVEAVRNVSRALQNAGIDSSEYSTILDQIAAAAQTSGISASTLTQNLTKYGAQLRAVGYDTDDIIALLAQFEISGINAETAIKGITTAVGKWGKAGKDSSEEFKQLVEEIKKAPSEADAAALAIENFGSKAGTELADAIRTGRLGFDDFKDVVSGAEGTVSRTFDETQGISDQIALTMNTIKIETGEVFEDLATKLTPQIEIILAYLADAADKYLPVIADAVGEIVTGVVQLTSSVDAKDIKIFKDLAEAIGGIFLVGKGASLVSKFVTAIKGFIPQAKAALTAATTELGAAGAASLGTTIAAGLIAFIAGFGIGSAIYDAIGDEIDEVLFPIFEKIENAYKLLIGGFKEVPETLADAGQKVVDVWTNIETLFTDKIPHFLTEVIPEWWDSLWEDIEDGFYNFSLKMGTIALAAWEAVKKPFIIADSWFKKKWDGIKNSFSETKQYFSDIFTGAWENIKSAFSGVGDFFSGIWDKIKETFTDIGTAVGDAIGGAFKTAINAVLETVENTINTVPDVINALVDTLNEIPGVDLDPLGYVSLPRLARGGIADRPVIAGEDGKEAIIPLEKNKAGLRELARLIAGEMGLSVAGVSGETSAATGAVTYNFTQTNNSPKALSRWDIYRQTKNLINAAKVGM